MLRAISVTRLDDDFWKFFETNFRCGVGVQWLVQYPLNQMMQDRIPLMVKSFWLDCLQLPAYFHLSFYVLFYKKWANPGLFLFIFGLFQTNNTIFTTNQCEKCPSSIRRWDSNPRPLERESPPITTRPGLSTSFYVLNSSINQPRIIES